MWVTSVYSAFLAILILTWYVCEKLDPSIEGGIFCLSMKEEQKGDEVLRSVPEEGAGPRPPLLLAQYLHRQADVFSVLLFSSQRDSDICASVLYIYHAYDRVA